MGKPLFSVTVRDLERGPKQLESEIPLGWLSAAFADTDATPVADGELEVELSKNGRQVMVRGTASARVQLPCAHTLDPVEVPLKADVFLLLSPAAPKTAARKKKRRPGPEAPKTKKKGGWPEDPVLADDQAAEDVYDGEHVVLDDFVREFLLLDLPMSVVTKELHQAPDAAIQPGPAESGARQPGPNTIQGEPPIDPRLAPLAEIASRLRKKKE